MAAAGYTECTTACQLRFPCTVAPACNSCFAKHLRVPHADLCCTGEAAPDAAPDRSCLQQKPLLRLLDSQKQKTARRLIIFMRALSAVVALVAFILGLFQRLLRTVAPSKAKQVCFRRSLPSLPSHTRDATQPRHHEANLQLLRLMEAQACRGCHNTCYLSPFMRLCNLLLQDWPIQKPCA